MLQTSVLRIASSSKKASCSVQNAHLLDKQGNTSASVHRWVAILICGLLVTSYLDSRCVTCSAVYGSVLIFSPPPPCPIQVHGLVFSMGLMGVGRTFSGKC